MQRHPSLPVPFCAGDFHTAETAGDIDPDSQRAHAHRVLHGAFHRPPERDPSLQLLRHRFSDQLRIDLRFADFDNIEVRFRTGHRRELRPQRFDILPLAADDHAGTRRVHRDAALAVRPFDHHPADAGLVTRFLDEPPDLQIFLQQISEFALVGVPAAVPGAVDLQAHADRIDFLPHQKFSSVSRTLTVSRENGLSIWPGRPRARALNRFIVLLLPTYASLTTSRSTSRL